MTAARALKKLVRRLRNLAANFGQIGYDERDFLREAADTIVGLTQKLDDSERARLFLDGKLADSEQRVAELETGQLGDEAALEYAVETKAELAERVKVLEAALVKILAE